MSIAQDDAEGDFAENDAAQGLSPQIRRSHHLAEAFRAIMRAVAEPGTIETLPPPTFEASPLSPAAAAIAQVLADASAPIWLAPSLAADSALARRLRFEIGAPLSESPERAAFLIGAWAEIAPALDRAPIGAPERPDLSASVIIEVQALSADPPAAERAAPGARLSGPGVPPDAPRPLFVAGAPPALFAFQQRNRTRFPLGLDIYLAAERQVAALPRHIAVEPL